jgi:hypothetical protein
MHPTTQATIDQIITAREAAQRHANAVQRQLAELRQRRAVRSLTLNRILTRHANA